MSTISSRNRIRRPADRMRSFATSHRWQSFLENSRTTGRDSDIGLTGGLHGGGNGELNDAIRRKVNPKATTRQAERARESLP